MTTAEKNEPHSSPPLVGTQGSVPSPIRKIGAYNILERISDGAQASIFKAAHEKTGELVAIKVFKNSGCSRDAEWRSHLEVSILKRLSHRNIVEYKDSFTMEDEWGITKQCVVMEFLKGQTLKECLSQFPQGLPWKDTLDILEQCLAALIFVQEEHGITHRDIKPSNIFILHDRRVKLLDFGIARLNQGETYTGGSGMMGSFDYMAPDYALAASDIFRGDQCSDIYSLFVCLYEMLTGSLPFPKLGERAELEYLSRWKNKHPNLSYAPVVFRLISHLTQFIARGLSVDRSKRFQLFTDVLDGLHSLRPRVFTSQGLEKYELICGLGGGGFGEVYKARRLSDNICVAIKRLFTDRPSERFVKEAHVLATHQHPNIVQYLDYFENQDAANTTHRYLVMEYLEGMPGLSLRDRIREHPSGLPPKKTLLLFLHFISALHFLHHHEQGIIHRDIKPSNLYAPLNDGKAAKLLDLGIVKDISGTITTGFVPGTWEYMAPEFVATGSRGTAQSDIYAIGLSLFEALTGKPFYPPLPLADKDAIAEYLARSRGEKALTVSFSHPLFTLHPDLKDVVAKATARDPAERYHDVADLWHALVKILREQMDTREDEFAAIQSCVVVLPEPEESSLLSLTRTQDRRSPTHVGFRRFTSTQYLIRASCVLIILCCLGLLAWQYRSARHSALNGMGVTSGSVNGNGLWSPLAGMLCYQRPGSGKYNKPQVFPAAARSSPCSLALVGTWGKIARADQAASAPNQTNLKAVHRNIVCDKPLLPPPQKGPTLKEPDETNYSEEIKQFIPVFNAESQRALLGYSYDTILSDIRQRCNTIRINCPSSALANPIINSKIKDWWLHLGNLVLQEAKDVQGLNRLLPIVRGCYLAAQPLYFDANTNNYYSCRNMLGDWRRKFIERGAPLLQSFPLETSNLTAIKTDRNGQYQVNPALEAYFASTSGVSCSARILPHKVTRKLMSTSGASPRAVDLPLALVPDGTQKGGQLNVKTPYYMAITETTLGAIRCYREDAQHLKEDTNVFFSGCLNNLSKESDETPYYRAKPNEAVEFCNWLSCQEGLDPVYSSDCNGHWEADFSKNGYRLPTIEEWEYAAIFKANYQSEGATTSAPSLAAIGSDGKVWCFYKTGPRISPTNDPSLSSLLGLYDMCGNVEEICTEHVKGDPASKKKAVRFALKGGSAKSRVVEETLPEYVARDIDETHEFVGFRVVRPVPIEIIQ